MGKFWSVSGSRLASYSTTLLPTKELGFPLFKRGARGMTLTPVAEQFRQRTQALRVSLGDVINLNDTLLAALRLGDLT
jgi:DNA-binding transcriptional LysR family regulator